MSREEVRSPCISLCALDENNICEGCYRSNDEIRLWRNMTTEEKQQTILRSMNRARELGRVL